MERGQALKNLVNEIAHPLLRIFQTSYITSAVADDWRLAYVSSIYKGAGSRCQTDYFRSVSLTSVVLKIMESLIRNELYNYLNVND